MASTYNPTQSYSATSTTGTTLPGTTTSSGTQGSTTQSSGLTAQQTAAFLQEFGIDSTDEPTFINGNQLTQAGQALQDYGTASATDRLTAQQTLVAMGYLAPTDANGEINSAATTAFKAMAATPNELPQYASALSNPTTPIQAQLNEQIAAGEKDVNTPVTVSLTPTATITQAITQAFNQNIGVTPSEAQINSFISQVQGQETGAQEAPRQQAQAEVAQAQTELTALKNLGPDGIDAFLQAYQQAVGGTGTQGSQVGTLTATPAYGAQAAMTAEPINAQTGQPLGNGPTAQIPNAPSGVLGAIGHDIAGGLVTAGSFGRVASPGGNTEAPGGVYGSRSVNFGATTTGAGAAATPAVAAGPAYGGIYALSPGEWKAAQTALGTSTALGKQAAQASSAGQASKAVQQAAAAALAQTLYDQYDNYSDVAIAMSGGDPSKVSGTATGTKTARQTFAESIANATNTQLTTLQNEVNNQAVTTKTANPTSTDISAEAAQAAKESDPVGYYAANAANWGSFLTKALYGTPLAEMQPTTSFAGPVGSAAQTAEAGSTTTTTPAPAAPAPAAVAA